MFEQTAKEAFVILDKIEDMLDVKEQQLSEYERYDDVEPDAWRMFNGEGGYDYTDDEETAERWARYLGEKYAHWLEPLYTKPQK